MSYTNYCFALLATIQAIKTEVYLKCEEILQKEGNSPLYFGFCQIEANMINSILEINKMLKLSREKK
jgi:hypothetical protein